MDQPEGSPIWEFLSTSRLVRYLLLFAFGWAIVQVFAYFQTVIVIFTLATIIAFLLNYPVQWLKQYTSHTMAVVVVFLGSLISLILLLATLGLAIIAELQEFVNQAPALIESVLDFLDQTESWLAQRNIAVELGFLQEELQAQLANGLGILSNLLSEFVIYFVELIIVLVISFFMLLNGGQIWQYLVSLFPQHLQDNLINSLRNNFLEFFRGRLILSTFFGISSLVVYLILPTPYPLLLAAIAGLFDLIPGIGATIGISLTALIALPQGVMISVQMIIYCVLLQQIEENVLMPRVMQDAVNLNPVVTFFAILMGTTIAGFLGLFLAVPVAAVIVSFFNLEALKG